MKGLLSSRLSLNTNGGLSSLQALAFSYLKLSEMFVLEMVGIIDLTIGLYLDFLHLELFLYFMSMLVLKIMRELNLFYGLLSYYQHYLFLK